MEACAENMTLTTYSIAAEDFGRAISIIMREKDMRFAIRIGQGTARLPEVITLAQKAQIVLLGHLPVNSTDPGTTVDLQQGQIRLLSHLQSQEMVALHRGQ